MGREVLGELFTLLEIQGEEIEGSVLVAGVVVCPSLLPGTGW